MAESQRRRGASCGTIERRRVQSGRGARRPFPHTTETEHETHHHQLAGALALTGCSGTPDCGSDETLSLVKEIWDRETAKQLTQALRREVNAAAIAENMQVRPTLVRMTDYNEQTDTYTCSASVEGKSSMANHTKATSLLQLALLHKVAVSS